MLYFGVKAMKMCKSVIKNHSFLCAVLRNKARTSCKPLFLSKQSVFLYQQNCIWPRVIQRFDKTEDKTRVSSSFICRQDRNKKIIVLFRNSIFGRFFSFLEKILANSIKSIHPLISSFFVIYIVGSSHDSCEETTSDLLCGRYFVLPSIQDCGGTILLWVHVTPANLHAPDHAETRKDFYFKPFMDFDVYCWLTCLLCSKHRFWY